MRYEPVKQFSKSKLVLGEGIDEWCLFRALLNHVELEQSIDVEQYGGKTKIRDGLKGVSKRPGFANVNSLGITRDADFCDERSADCVMSSAFESVCSALENAGLPIPSRPFTPEITSYQGREFRIGVFIFPGPSRNGMLEDLCLDAASSDPALECVDAIWPCLVDKFPDKSRTHSKEAFPKARIHAWLATLKKPDCRLGEAAFNGDINFSHPAFNDFKEFLRQL